jgi:hypothetical protein
MAHDAKYNGWTNYATWRINLEMVDGCEPDTFGIDEDSTAYETGQQIKDWCEEIVSEGSSGLALDYAMAFMSDVNWTEIAEHLIEQYAEENEAA